MLTNLLFKKVKLLTSIYKVFFCLTDRLFFLKMFILIQPGEVAITTKLDNLELKAVKSAK